MSTLNENLISEIHSTAKRKGFWNNPRDIKQAKALIISEIGEMLEAHRSNNICITDVKSLYEISDDNKFKRMFESQIKDTYQDELADIYIRLYDTIKGFNFDLPESNDKYKLSSTDFAVICYDLIYSITNMYDEFNHTFNILNYIVENYGIDIEHHIIAKMRYNKTREKLHGKNY